MIFVFKCMTGLGNRLCNLFNMFYLHKIYPSAEIYLIWSINNHCGAKLDELIDMTQYRWIRTEGEYMSKVYPRFRNIMLYAYTCKRERTRWDNPDEWGRHQLVVSVPNTLYSFIPHEFCVETYNAFSLTVGVAAAVQATISRYGINRELIHFRTGDLLKILDDNKESHKARLVERFTTIKAQFPAAAVVEYTQMIVDRPAVAVIEAFAELVFYTKHCRIVAYTPYSWFSSLVIFLNSGYRAGLPVFDSDILDIIQV